MAEITVNNVKPIFFTRTGIPKKECLKCNDDIMESLTIKFSLDKYKKQYENNLVNAVVRKIRKHCREHHIQWSDVRIGKIIYHGFTVDEEKIKDSLHRQFTRMKKAQIIFTESKQIIQSQLQITFNFDKTE